DSDVLVKQSLEEQTPAALVPFGDRAEELDADVVTVLPGGSVPGTRRICTVRTAGTAASPRPYPVNATAAVASRPADPSTGARSFLPTVGAFDVTFPEPVSGAGPGTFVVNGSQCGRYFRTGSYTGNGTPTVSTPTGTFFPGEEVEVVLT